MITSNIQVGSVVAVGVVQASGSVKWSTFRNISLSWLVTLPVTGNGLCCFHLYFH